MTEAFTVCVLFDGEEAKDFRHTMTESTPAEQIISEEGYAKMQDIAKEPWI